MKDTQRSHEVGENTGVLIRIKIPVKIDAPVGTKSIKLFLGLSDSGYIYAEGGGGSGLLIADAILRDSNGDFFFPGTSLPHPQNGMGTNGYAILFNDAATRAYQTPGRSFSGTVIASFNFWAFSSDGVDESSQFALLDRLDSSNPVDKSFVDNFIPLEVLQNFDSEDFGIRLTLQALAIPEPATPFLLLLALGLVAVARRCKSSVSANDQLPLYCRHLLSISVTRARSRET
jgi:hypothetical protein